MILVIGKRGKTANVLAKFLDTKNSYYISDNISLYGIKTISNNILDREFPVEKENNFTLITNCDLIKVNNFVISNRIRNCTLIIDSNTLLNKYTLKEVKNFECMNNLQVVITFSSVKEDILKEIEI